MKVGLTGGIGSGKSSVATFLRAQNVGGCYMDADLVCRELLEPGAPGWLALRRILAPDFFGAEQVINRPLLREALFKDSGLRQRINRRLHPLARQEIRQRLGRREALSPGILIIVEVPLLFEAGWEKDFDSIVVVYAGRAQCLKRLMRRDRITAAEAQIALDAQWPLADKVFKAEHVVDNSGAWTDTCLQLFHLVKLLRDNKDGEGKKT